MRNTGRRPRYRLRALVQLLAVCAALLLIAVTQRDKLYVSQAHMLHCILRRNLASNAEVIYHIKTENDWGFDIDERLYLLRWGSDIGSLRTMIQRKGNMKFYTRRDEVRSITMHDGVGIAPLYSTVVRGMQAIGTCAVVTTRDDVARVELRFHNRSGFSNYYYSNESRNGIFLFEVHTTSQYDSMFDVYKGGVRDHFGVTAYDQEGNTLVHIAGTWEMEASDEN